MLHVHNGMETIKFKIKQGKAHLEQATKAQREVRVQIYSFLNLGARWE